jgi:hypothetical protein
MLIHEKQHNSCVIRRLLQSVKREQFAYIDELRAKMVTTILISEVILKILKDYVTHPYTGESYPPSRQVNTEIVIW